jgi:hypothetical protein
MGLKVWSLALAGTLVLILLISLLTGILTILDLALLTVAILLLLASYLNLVRKDNLTKIPTALEMEKMKRKMRAEDSGILVDPGKKT